jgi:hypothetical protein
VFTAGITVTAAAVPAGHPLGPFRQPDEWVGQPKRRHGTAESSSKVRQSLGDAEGCTDL